MYSARWIASLKWYLNLVISLLKQDAVDAIKDKQVTSSQQALWRDMSYLWLGIVTAIILFLCWLWLWLRIPAQHPLSNPVLIKASVSKPQSNTRFKLTAQTPTFVGIATGLEDGTTEQPNKLNAENPSGGLPEGHKTKRIQTEWGLLSIDKTQGVSATNNAGVIASTSDDDCDDISICNTVIDSDVVIHTTN